MNKYEFKVTYNTGRLETYEIECSQDSEAYHVIIGCALNDVDDDNEILFKVELIKITVIWVYDEDE